MRNLLLTGIVAMLCIAPVLAYEVPNADGPAGAEVYIITLEEPGALKYQGGTSGLDGTARIIRGPKKNAGSDPDVKAYLDHLDGVLGAYGIQLNAALGRVVEPLLQYKVRTTGMAVLLTEAEARHVAGIPGVVEVRKDVMYELVTDAGPQWIGADSIWDGSATPGSMPNTGEGVVVGVLDTGVNMDHPSFSDSPEDGHTYVNPLGGGTFVGWCDPGNPDFDPAFVCNDKLIGAWDFTDAVTAEDDGPEDNNGHGSHTASTAVGNFISGPIPLGGGDFPAPSISGVARHANVITYDVCFDSCPGAAIGGAIDQALLDGVDIVNFSITGGTFPWDDANELGFLDLLGNGTLVNAAAGNTSSDVPDPVGNVNHRGPWVNTIAAQTHHRVSNNEVSVVGLRGLDSMYGLLGVVDNFGGMDVTEVAVWAGSIGDGGNFEGCSAWTGPYAADFTDQILLISRGTCTFEDKINFASDASAVAVLIFNHLSVIPIVMGGIESTTIPSLMIGRTDGEALRDHITDNPGTMVTMSGTSVYDLIDSVGSILAAFSFRGPNEDFDVTKPDIGGPGVNVLAGWSDVIGDPPQFAIISGTSMATPHTAGSAALVKSLHPDWSPSQIKSALMITAKQSFDEAGDPAHHDHDGSGTIDLTKAAISGLVMNETFANYLAADPAMGGDPATLNLPSMRANDCNGTCEWTRTVCNALEVTTAWTVNTPPPNGYEVTVDATSFDVLAGPDTLFKGGFESGVPATSSCQTFTVTVTVNDMALVTAGKLIFDEITISEDAAQASDARLTITFLPTGVAP